MALARGCWVEHSVPMPKWVWGLILILILVTWIIPSPASAGAAVGDAIDALITFFRSVGTAAST
jgi:hypothetical protein